MRRVLITCPVTGRPTPTGMDYSPEAYQTAHISGHRVDCAHCGGTHVVTKADTYLEGDPPPPAAPASP